MIRALPQILVNLVAPVADDFAGVEEVVGIKRLFDLAHDPIKLLANLFAEKFGAGDAHAVFGGEGTLELNHEGRDFIGDLAEFFQILGAVQIQDGPHMQKAGGGVTVEGGG